MDLCSMLDYDCRAYENWDAGKAMFEQILLPAQQKLQQEPWQLRFLES